MGEAFRFKPHWSHERIDEARCRASVSSGSMGLAQCSRKATHAGEWCKQHAPETLEAKRQERDAEWARAAEVRRENALRAEHAARVAELEKAVVEACVNEHEAGLAFNASANLDESGAALDRLNAAMDVRTAAVDALLHERARGGTTKETT